MIETLVELCQGVYENQLDVFNSHGIDAINFILGIDFPWLEPNDYAGLMLAVAQLVQTFLEDNSDKTAQLASDVVSKLCTSSLRQGGHYRRADVVLLPYDTQP
jgi:hypothetical protein